MTVTWKQVDADDATVCRRSHALSGDEGPTARCGAQVDDDLPSTEKMISKSEEWEHDAARRGCCDAVIRAHLSSRCMSL